MPLKDDAFITPAQARETFKCPLARTIHDKKGPNCEADHCILWRWRPQLASDPEFTTAISKEIDRLSEQYTERTGKKRDKALEHNEAVRQVMQNPEAHGIKRTKGYCGLGGMVS